MKIYKERPDCDIIKKFICEGCQKKFRRKDILLKHKRKNCNKKVQKKKNKCRKCVKTFDGQANLIRHESIHLENPLN